MPKTIITMSSKKGRMETMFVSKHRAGGIIMPKRKRKSRDVIKDIKSVYN